MTVRKYIFYEFHHSEIKYIHLPNYFNFNRYNFLMIGFLNEKRKSIRTNLSRPSNLYNKISIEHLVIIVPQ